MNLKTMIKFNFKNQDNHEITKSMVQTANWRAATRNPVETLRYE